MSCDFIEDGYTERGYIKPVDGLHGPLEFEYRPALGALSDRITSLSQGERPDMDRFWQSVAKALARDPGLLKSRSLKNSKGETVPITEANIQRVRQLLVNKLWLIVSGHIPSDNRPDGVNVEADAKN